MDDAMPETEGGAMVLVVDDDHLVLPMLARALAEAGYRVQAVGTAEAALDVLAAQLAPAVVVADATLTPAHVTVVSDVQLPAMNGCELGRQIVRRWPGVRMLFISGYYEEDLAQQGMCVDNLPLLRKPFWPSALVRAVDRCLAAPPWNPDAATDGGLV